MLGRDIVPAYVGAMLPALVRFCSPSVTMNSTTFCIDLLFERQWIGFCESHSISHLRSVIHVFGPETWSCLAVVPQLLALLGNYLFLRTAKRLCTEERDLSYQYSTVLSVFASHI